MLIGCVEEEVYLKVFGVLVIIDCNELLVLGKFFGKECWVGVVDVVGSYMLVNVCVIIKYCGVVVVCGLV